MHFTNKLITLALFLACTFATEYNVTTPTQDYYLLSERKLKSDIEFAQLKIDSVDARGADSIRLLNDQNQIVLKEIQNTEESLVPVQALSPIRKHCVQKYKPLLKTYDTAKVQFASCLSAAQKRVDTITTTAKTTLNTAKVNLNTNLPKAITTCNTSHAQNQTKLEECVLSNVESYTRIIQGNLNTVDKNLEAGLCTLSDASGDEIRCSFSIEKSTLVTIGSVLDLIDNCIQEAELLCPCAAGNGTRAETESLIRHIILGPA